MPENLDHIEQLISQKLTGNISAEENAELLQLIANDEEVKKLWEETEEAFLLFDAGTIADRFDETAAWNKVQQSLNVTPPSEAVTPTRTIGLRKYYKYAAMLIFAMAVGSVLFYFWYEQNKPHEVPANMVVLKMANGKTIEIAGDHQNINVVTGKTLSVRLGSGEVLADAKKDDIGIKELNTLLVPPGRDYHLILADGTEVWLNAGSEFKFPLSFSDSTRNVQLMGEAYFKVAHDRIHPFIVKTPTSDVNVLGTEFNVKCYPYEVNKTSLIKGKVALHSIYKEYVVLMPGTEAKMRDDNHFEIETFDEDRTLGWMKGLYIFKDEDLRSIQWVIKRWYDIDIVMDKSDVSEKKFTGALDKSRPIEEFLTALSKSSGIKYHKQNGKIHLYN